MATSNMDVVNKANTTKATQCEYYGSFMHELSRPKAEAMYWILFIFVLCLLFSSSWYYGRVMERIENMTVGDAKRQRLIYNCFYKTLICGGLALITAILEAFDLLTLQFCDQEPLASLYWSTWTVLQVGAVVAIFGISLHVRHMIKGSRPPPWALALGTPVLVVAGLGHYFQGKVKRRVRSVSQNLKSRSRSSEPTGKANQRPLGERPIVRHASFDFERRPRKSDEVTPSLYTDVPDEFNAKVIGYTKEGDIIIRLAPSISLDFKTRVKGQSGSITWDEQVPATPRIGRSRHRSSSIATFKGKEREPTLQQRDAVSIVDINGTHTVNSRRQYTDGDEKDVTDANFTEMNENDSLRLGRVDSQGRLIEAVEERGCAIRRQDHLAV